MKARLGRGYWIAPISVAAVMMAVGCGGQSATTSLTPHETGSVLVSVNWSSGSKKPMVPTNAQSVLIEVIEQEHSVAHAIVNRDPAGGTVQTSIQGLPVQAALIRATAYTGQNGSGDTITRGSKDFALKPGPNRTAITLDHPVSLQIDNFANSSLLQFVGSTQTVGSVMRICDTSTYIVGGAWSQSQMDVFAGFDVSFKFQITNPSGSGETPGADGFAFVIQDDNAKALGGTAQDLGYTGINDSIAIEFDTYANYDYGDPDNNHISVHTNGVDANSADEKYSIGTTSNIPNLRDGNSHAIQVSYRPGHLKIFMDGGATPILDVAKTLSEILPLKDGKAWIGFTGATGSSYENLDILSLTYTSI